MIDTKNNKEYTICLRLRVFTINLGAIYCGRTKMRTGVKTLKTAVMYDVINKTCCMERPRGPVDGAFALHFHPHRCSLGARTGAAGN